MRSNLKVPERQEGIVSRMSYKSGYGMITIPPDTTEYFFHASAVLIEDEDEDPAFEDFNTGDRVSFIPSDGDKGLKALGVVNLEITGAE